MHFLPLTFSFILAATSITASPIPLFRRDQFPSIPSVDPVSNKIFELPGTAADIITKRDNLMIPVVDVASGMVLEHVATSGGSSSLKPRDEFPALVAIDPASNQLIEITGTAADLKRDLAIPAVSQTINTVVELVGTGAGSAKVKREANGVIPVVTDGNRVTVIDMVAEGISE